MKTKYLFITLAAALAVGGFIYTAKAVERPRLNRFRGGILQRAAEKLELTDSQKKQIKAELLAEKDTLKQLLGRLHEARTDLRDAIRASAATEVSVRVASAKVAAAQADLAVERLKLHGKIAPILTEEQKAKIAAFEARVDKFLTDALENLGSRLTE
ncbi:MAG: Spy/CpxP family protein refolding chaperone [Verrucomicrobiota bacterium]